MAPSFRDVNIEMFNFLPEDEMILTSRKLGANKILSSEVFNKKISKKGLTVIVWDISGSTYSRTTYGGTTYIVEPLT